MNNEEIIEEFLKEFFNNKLYYLGKLKNSIEKQLAEKDAEYLKFLKKQNIIGIEDMFSNFRKDNCGVLKGNEI